MKPFAYEGSEPYIFVSYAHRDSERVFEVLEELQNRGYRFWYDDGIAPGSEWPEDIARHLDAAAMVMAFVTPNSMKSQNCRREINFSLSREKPFLSVLLEKTDMPLGMQMQLSAQQSILRYNYNSWDGFIAKILACPDIVPCREEPKPEPEPEPEPQPEAAMPQPVEQKAEASAAMTPSVMPNTLVTEITEPVAEQTVAKTAPAPKPVPREEPAPRKEAAPKKLKTAVPSSKAKGGNKLLPLVIGAVALVAVIFVAVMALGGSGGGSTSSSSSKAEAPEVPEGALTQKALEARLTKADSSWLDLKGCDLSACDLSAPLDLAERYTSVDLTDATGVDSLAFLSEATNIHSVCFDNTDVSDLAPLANLTKLTDVSGCNTKVTSLEPLVGLEKLNRIDLSGCALEAPSENLASLRLREVSLANTGLSDLSWLSDVTLLETLDVSGNPDFVDISWLDSQNYEHLKSVDLSRTGLTSGDLGWLSECPAIKTLKLDGVSLDNLDMCADMSELEYLSATGCGLTSIEGLGRPSLRVALLACNKIQDASPLSPMSEEVNRIVDLSYNKLETVEGVAAGHYKALLLYGNSKDIGLTLDAEHVDVYDVTVPYCKGIEKGPLANKGTFGAIYMVDCPKNKQVAVGDALGNSYLTFVSEDELLKIYADNSFDYSMNVDWSYFLELVESGQTDGVPHRYDVQAPITL